jgi:DNA polymerase elongation subunit (family B)
MKQMKVKKKLAVEMPYVKKYISAATSYTGDVILSYRDENGRRHAEYIEKYAHNEWYFYIKYEDYEEKIAGTLEEHLSEVTEESLKLTKIENPVRFEVESNHKWVKVFVRNEGVNEKYSDKIDDRIKLKSFLEEDGIQIFEGDLKPHKRYCIDNDIEVADNFKVLYYDIETDDRNHGIVVGRDRILSIAGYDQDGVPLFVCNQENEEELLMDFIERIKYDYDILVGWNSDTFDKPYIAARLKKFFLEKAMHIFRKIAHIDLMQVFIKRFSNDTKITSWSLEFIANYFLGYGKVELEGGKGGGKLYELYETNFEKFKEYNLKDAHILYSLNQKLGIIDQMILECQLTGAFPDKYSISELLDTYILRSVKGQDIHFPSIEYTKHRIQCPECGHIHTSESTSDAQKGSVVCEKCGNEFDPTDQGDITGAYVFDPVVGLHDHVHTLDYKSLYPSIIITWNIGPDTYTSPETYQQLIASGERKPEEFIKSANDQYFLKEHPSAITTAIKKLLEKRGEFKKEMLAAVPESKEYDVANAKQRATKVLCNSMYGIMGYSRGRYYKREIAEAITLGGQWLNKTTKTWLEESKGYPVIYGDTDSQFVKMFDGANKILPGLLAELHSFYDVELKKQFNVDEHLIELEYEKHFRRLILIGKKRYAGHIVEQDGAVVDKLLVKGLEYVKRDTIPLAKKWQKELLDLFINHNNDLDFYIKWVEGKLNDFFQENFSMEDITIRKKMTKRPESYKANIPAHVKVAIEMKKREQEYYIGMYVPYIVISEKPIDAIHPEWIKTEPEKGYKPSPIYYWDKQVYSICERILAVVFPKYDWDQYTTKIKERRDKKFKVYVGWVDDPKKQTAKRKETTIQKITECKIITKSQKDELLQLIKPKQLKLKEVEEAPLVKTKMKISVKKRTTDILSDQDRYEAKEVAIRQEMKDERRGQQVESNRSSEDKVTPEERREEVKSNGARKAFSFKLKRVRPADAQTGVRGSSSST